MRKFAVMSWLILPMMCAAQSVKKPAQTSNSLGASKLFTVASVIEVEAASRNAWFLAFGSNQMESPIPPRVGEVAAGTLDAYISESPEKNNWGCCPGLIAEHTLMARNRNDLERVVKVSVGPLLYAQTPVRFALRNGSLTLLITSLASANVYNTLRLEAKERAAEEIEKTILPEIKQVSVIRSPTIKNFGAIAIYGTKDFSASDSSPKPELVALVASVENCRKLAQAEITEEDFVASSDVYIVDNDQTSSEIRKVKISLDKE